MSYVNGIFFNSFTNSGVELEVVKLILRRNFYK